MSAPRLRAGVIGLGAMGRNHARVLSGLDGVELVGCSDPAVTDTRVSHGAPIHPTVEALVEAGVDYAVVACPTGLHEEVGLYLAEHGVAALVEKPLADSEEGARRLVEAFESRGLVAGVGHIERYNPALQSLRERLSAGDLGEIYQVVTRRQGPFPARIADVGVVKDLATHDIDLTAWVTGRQYLSVSARTSRKSGREHEDMVAVVADLEHGTIANHLVNWLSPLKERATIVTGEKGCFVADTLTADLTFYANGATTSEWETMRNFRGVSEGDMTRYAIARREPLLVEHERFRDAVLGVADDIVTVREGMRTVEVSSAVLRAAEQGGTVSVAATLPA
ncbi:Gfo/Idh/MocA family protein [Nocardioides dongkuii]|uniref:Gfo/Idh/MocA family protein n=1 Tax=Nocardioides dongkuii TaxID=2760089 RepID=UPI0015F88125|nr:Gfo/Idh/MocA family oxidoreductase [Nocardioides dongkuii]